ncbi:MAG: hypothetical protein K8T89_25930 [Planctomycetes bacterium]|nr:hypothetical protein [Planctomycetota bacterium]
MKNFIVCLIALLGTAPVWGKLEITKMEGAQGPLGPVRETLDFYPLDEILFRYQVAGAKTDADGKTDVEVEMKLTSPTGKKVFDTKNTAKRLLSLGANTYPAFVIMNVPENAPPGEYTLSLNLTDRIGKETATIERKLTCKPISFQIVAIRFWRDPDGKIPAPAGGMVGESVHFKLRVIGFDKSKKKVQTTLSITVLDDKGKPVHEKPQIIKAELNNPDDAVKATQVNYNGLLYLNRAGNFTLVLAVDDVLGDKKVKFETPLKVLAP